MVCSFSFDLCFQFQKLRKNFTPDIFWGPAMVRHRVKVVHLKNFDIDPHWQGIVKLAHET